MSLFSYFTFETENCYVAHAGLEYTPSCLSLLSALIRGLALILEVTSLWIDA